LPSLAKFYVNNVTLVQKQHLHSGKEWNTAWGRKITGSHESKPRNTSWLHQKHITLGRKVFSTNHLIVTIQSNLFLLEMEQGN